MISRQRIAVSNTLDLVTYYRGESINPKINEAFEWADKNVFNLIEDKGVMLAGGALRSFFTDTPVRDYDIYLPVNDGSLSDSIESLLLGKSYKRTSLTKKSFSYRRVFFERDNSLVDRVYNVIKSPQYETAQDVIAGFDYTICMCAITEDMITYHPDYFMDLTTRTLRINNPEDILNSVWRLQKYIKLGYTISREELWKIVNGIHDLTSLPVAVGDHDPESKAVPLSEIFTTS